MSWDVRPFRRSDREQVAQLVNRHAAAVVPGAGASVNSVLGQFEREADEFIVEPWMDQRRALVAEQDGAIVAAALLVRYRGDAHVGATYRNTAEIRWLLFRPMAPPGNPYWRDARPAAEALLAACLDQCREWRVARVYADGSLPIPGVYGVPEQWPHVRQLYRDTGFVPDGATEIVLLADLAGLPDPGQSPVPGMRQRRLLGINGTRFAAELGDECVGYLETEELASAERHARQGGLADIGNLYVTEGCRRRGIGTWLLRHAALWLRQGRVDRLLAYTTVDATAELAFLAGNGFVEISRTQRGWHRPV
jgi:GNAT superfamily N-acetyltransferase